jgi:hypothetical protein
MVNVQRQTDPSKQSLTDDIVVNGFHNNGGFGSDRYTLHICAEYVVSLIVLHRSVMYFSFRSFHGRIYTATLVHSRVAVFVLT